jgi:hypothetical protein
MLAYDFLKSNPRQNAKRMQCGWRELFADKDCPGGVKQELLELDKLTDDISDAVLYFHQKFVIRKFTNPTERFEDRQFTSRIYHKRYMEAMYSFVQLHPEYEPMIVEIFLKGNVSTEIYPILEELTNKELWLVIDFCVSARYEPGVVPIIHALNPACLEAVGRNNVLGRQLFTYMTLDFIRSTAPLTLYRAQEMFRDVPEPPANAKYKSLNEIERAHEAQTEEAVSRLLAMTPAKIVYDKRFVDIIEANGFKLPATRNDLIKRGALHHNCVATYSDRHVHYADYGPMCRLIFTHDGTAELRIHIKHGLIVCVEVPQFKGMRNADIDQSPELTQIRIGLTGQPMEILRVSEKE